MDIITPKQVKIDGDDYNPSNVYIQGKKKKKREIPEYYKSYLKAFFLNSPTHLLALIFILVSITYLTIIGANTDSKSELELALTTLEGMAVASLMLLLFSSYIFIKSILLSDNFKYSEIYIIYDGKIRILEPEFIYVGSLNFIPEYSTAEEKNLNDVDIVKGLEPGADFLFEGYEVHIREEIFNELNKSENLL